MDISDGLVLRRTIESPPLSQRRTLLVARGVCRFRTCPLDLGPEGTGFGQQIRQKLELIRHTVKSSINCLPRSIFYSVTPSITFSGINMSLLSTVEARLGSFDEWPSSILRLLFVDSPTIRNVAVFFYGYGGPCATCSQTYHACNGNTNSYVTETVDKLYETWQRSPFEPRMARYNFRHRRCVYLNGHRVNQLEIARGPRRGIGPLGIAGLGLPNVN